MASNWLVVFGPEIGRGPHAGEKRRQMGGSGLVQNRRQRRLRRLGLHAPQHVVGAKLDDQRVGVGGNRPVVAREAVRRRVAGDAGVDDLDVEAFGAQRRLEAIGKSLAGRLSRIRRSGCRPRTTRRSVRAAAACEAVARTAAKASAWTRRRKCPYEGDLVLRCSNNGLSCGRDARRRPQSRPRRGSRAYLARRRSDNRQGRGGRHSRRVRLGQIDAA